uniref:Reverse transcriptase domain-containing protein n=1 Tax=Tanacetum cinerariifolium TaxID=118510 RepID=A0A6L2M9A5_TANCI|nr:hypothetical protein [Tanacetum cinerariifolium]
MRNQDSAKWDKGQDYMVGWGESFGTVQESTFPLNEIDSQIPPSNPITPILPTIEDPEDFLIIRNEELSTIPEKESDEFIKSSVEDLFPIPSESDDTSESDTNPLFEFDDEYISSNVNPPFDKVLENIDNKDSYDSNLDELELLVAPLSDDNEDECFDPILSFYFTVIYLLLK